jgi:hypothetical protein
MKKIFFLIVAIVFSSSLFAQLSITKMVGKNANKYRLGYDLFCFYEFPLNSEGYSKSIRLDILDFAYFPGKDGNGFTSGSARAYLAIKVGYKLIFSETRTGWYIEPSLGYARVVEALEDAPEATYGDGFAAAAEVGYNLEVGQKGHELAVGLKYETDRAGTAHTISSVGLRFSYSFNMFRKRERD